MIRLTLVILLISFSATYAIDNRKISGHSSRFLSEASRFLKPVGGEKNVTRWAVLVAGSRGWSNYRHQADMCHAYQVLKKGGLKDENIVVMMYDDIAHHPENPRPGVIINSPNGSDVYHGVPKDYTGESVNAKNFYSVLLGYKDAIKGGTKKVVNSGPNDHIFVFYVDHGSPLTLGMPHETIYAEDLNKVLKKKHDLGTYKSLVFYLEACEAGSMFDGLLSKDLNIYVTTASNTRESSFGYYCPGDDIAPPAEYDICLGDLYSIAWMEDWDQNSSAKATLQEQFQRVKGRTFLSHVMEYGDIPLSKEKVSAYIGTNSTKDTYANDFLPTKLSSSVDQRDAELVYLRAKLRRAPEGSERKLEAQNQIIEAIKHRKNVDNSIEMIGKLLFGSSNGLEVMTAIRPEGQAPVDDWDCFKALVRTYEAKCGALSSYGRKHTRVFANLCNAGIQKEQLETVLAQACPTNV